MWSNYFVICLSGAMLRSNLVAGVAHKMAALTITYGKLLEECRNEVNLSNEIIEEFHHLWDDMFPMIHKELGCAIMCMSNKLQLLDINQRMNHENTRQYVVSSVDEGDDIAQHVLNIWYSCEQRNDEMDDHCWRILENMKCFKDVAKKEDIAPSFDMLIDAKEKHEAKLQET